MTFNYTHTHTRKLEGWWEIPWGNQQTQYCDCQTRSLPHTSMQLHIDSQPLDCYLYTFDLKPESQSFSAEWWNKLICGKTANKCGGLTPWLPVMTKGLQASCLGNSPNIAGHKWAALPVMTRGEKKKRKKARVMWELWWKCLWAGMEVINNAGLEAEKLHYGVLCCGYASGFYLLKCPWTRMLHCKPFHRD